MPNILLIDRDLIDANNLIAHLRARNIQVTRVNDATEAITSLGRSNAPFEVIIVNVSDGKEPWFDILGQLRQSSFRDRGSIIPLYLCVSHRQREPHFELEIERKGARYVFSPHNEPWPVVTKVDVLLAELRELRSSGPHLRIYVDTSSGELMAVRLVQRSHEIRVPLSSSLREMFAVLAASHFGLNASQIAASMNRNGRRKRSLRTRSGKTRYAKVGRTSVKEFVRRIRLGLGQAFLKGNLDLDPQSVLMSVGTVMNSAEYRLKATCDWVYLAPPNGRVSEEIDGNHSGVSSAQ